MATATEVLAKLSGMIADWQLYLDNLANWSGGTGTKPLQDAAGNQRQVKTPHELDRTHTAAVDNLNAHMKDIEDAHANAQSAIASKNAAKASELKSKDWATKASVVESGLHSSKTYASQSATSASQSLASKNAAKTSETNALNSKNAAATSASQALASKNAAEAAKNVVESNAQVPKNATSLGVIDLNTLNSFNHAGYYHQELSNNGTPERNYPIHSAGSLKVLKAAAGVTQEYMEYSKGHLFTRGCYNGAWSPWTQFTADESTQFLVWSSSRTYRTGEVCYKNEGGNIVFYQMYSGPNRTCVGKDPSLAVNRKDGWTHATDPWYWTPYTGATIGSHFWWLSGTPPLWGLNENSADLKATKYWRVAALYPELVSGGLLKLASGGETIGSRFIRATNGNVHVKQGDAIRNITGNNGRGYNIITQNIGEISIGAFAFSRGQGSHGNLAAVSTYNSSFDFDASRVVPTAIENRPINISRMSCIHI